MSNLPHRGRSGNLRSGNPYVAYLQRRRETERPTRRYRRDKTYFELFPSDLDIMTAEEAALFSHLLNYGQTKKCDDAGEFVAMPGLNEAGLGLSPEDDRRLMDALAAKGFLEYRWTAGDDGRRQRLVRLNVANVKRALAGKPVVPTEQPVRPDPKRKPSRKHPYTSPRRLGFGLTS